ncbi:unnamed protein product [Lepidochelys kempii]
MYMEPKKDNGDCRKMHHPNNEVNNACSLPCLLSEVPPSEASLLPFLLFRGSGLRRLLTRGGTFATGEAIRKFSVNRKCLHLYCYGLPYTVKAVLSGTLSTSKLY